MEHPALKFDWEIREMRVVGTYLSPANAVGFSYVKGQGDLELFYQELMSMHKSNPPEAPTTELIKFWDNF